MGNGAKRKLQEVGKTIDELAASMKVTPDTTDTT